MATSGEVASVNGAESSAQGELPADEVEAQPHRGYRLPLAAMKSPHLWLHRQILHFRRLVEAAVAAAHGGEIGPVQASRVRTACTAARQALRIERILADAGEPGTSGKLTHEQWLSYNAALLRAEECRDKALSNLGLDTNPKDQWSNFYRQPAHLSHAPEHPTEQP